jgi:uncharacterized protein YkwD
VTMPREIRTMLCLCLATLIGACAGSRSQDAMTASPLSVFEQEVLTEMNRARTNPTEYAAYLQTTKREIDANLPPLSSTRGTHNDVTMGMFSEALAFLTSSRLLPALTFSRGMASAARDHLNDQMQADTLGHAGRNGSTIEDRLARYGSWEADIGETLVYGSSTAKRLVQQMVIDYDNPGRPRRQNLFNPNFSVAGIACGNPTRYPNLCVITFAGRYREKAAER